MINNIIQLVYTSGDIAKNYLEKGFITKEKQDQSPVTEADIEISNYLIKEIKRIFPNDEILSEENIIEMQYNNKVWMIDPIDGTKNFINGDDKFSIIVGCIENNEPILGIIYFPLKNVLYYAEKGKGCYRIDENNNKVKLNYNSKIFLEESDICYKPSISRIPDAQELLHSIVCKSKTELRPSGFIASEILNGKYDNIILGGGYIYELTSISILFKEAGLYFGPIQTNRNINWQVINPKIQETILGGNIFTCKEISDSHFFQQEGFKKNYINKTAQTKTYFQVVEDDIHNIPKTIDNLVGAAYNTFFIITDKNIYKLYTGLFRILEKKQNYKTIILNPGEKNKSLDSYKEIVDQLLSGGISSKSLIINIGGGVIGNLGGFIASTLFRGIDFIHIPTTFLAQSDSCIGGKQGINTQYGKNTIGTIKEPIFTIINKNFLKTLSKREILNGISESIKHAFIQDKGLLEWFSQNSYASIKYDETTKLMDQTLELKLQLINKNNIYKGIGTIMKYGHEIGHAIENISNNYLHGEAISIGICLTAFILYKSGYITKTLFDRHIFIFSNRELPIIWKGINTADILKQLQKENYFRNNYIELVSIYDGGDNVKNLNPSTIKTKYEYNIFTKYLEDYINYIE